MRYAFLVAVNKYRNGDINYSNLRGCENDIAARGQTRDNLVKGYGFSDTNIQMLFNERATRKAIWEQLEEYITILKSGDELIWWMSCHGTRYPIVSKTGGYKAANVICASDFSWTEPVLTGPALKELFVKKRPGTKILVVLDSCHSGDSFRDLRPLHSYTSGQQPMPNPAISVTSMQNSIPRYVRPPADILHRFRCLPKNRGLGQNPEVQETPKGLLFFSGCDFDETSADAYIDGDYHGAFTHTFWKAVNEAEGQASFYELITRVRTMLKAAGYRQNPGLEGDPDEAKAVFLGGSISEVPVPTEPKPPVQETPPKPDGSFADGYNFPENWV